VNAFAGVLAAALAIGIAARGVRLAVAPPFVVGAPAPVRDAVRIEGLRAALRPDGSLLLTAAACEAGHDRVGPLWLGVPTHLRLRDVELRDADPAQPMRWLRASAARWDGAALALDGPIHGEDAAGAVFAASARVVDGVVVLGR
jgi:hypothetical protein